MITPLGILISIVQQPWENIHPWLKSIMSKARFILNGIELGHHACFRCECFAGVFTQIN